MAAEEVQLAGNDEPERGGRGGVREESDLDVAAASAQGRAQAAPSRIIAGRPFDISYVDGVTYLVDEQLLAALDVGLTAGR